MIEPPKKTELPKKTEDHAIVQLSDEPCCSLQCCNTTINRFCCKIYKDRNDIEGMLAGIELTAIQKQHIQSRYINILENLKKRVRKYTFVFFVGHFIITVGSLFVPALLSLQNSVQSVSFPNGATISVNTFTFIVSLLVTIFNGILTLFKIDKQYYFLTTTMEKLRSEGWQFLGLTGRYSGKLNDMTPTHSNQFLYFAHQIEVIKMKQVEEEFYKSNESTADVRSNGTKQTDLYPPSLMAPVTDIVEQIPSPIKDVVESIIKTQTDDKPKVLEPFLREPNSSFAITIPDSLEPKNTIINPSSEPLRSEPLRSDSLRSDSLRPALMNPITDTNPLYTGGPVAIVATEQ